MKKKIISLLLIVSSLLLSMTFSVNSYADTQVAFYIKHVHTGDSSAGTGCYTTPIYHTHSPEGGDCYSPVYHTHEGTPETCGGCYTVPVLHHHTGDESSEGGCYVPRYHEHSGACYQTASCYVSVSMHYYTYHNERCGYHGDVTFAEYEVVEDHSACGAHSNYMVKFCPKCGANVRDSYEHTYSRLICPISTDTVEGYKLGCGHEEGDIDHYDPGCNLEGTIVGYELTCTRTSSDIDGYDVGCGIEEGEPIAKVVIDNDGNGYTDEVNITANIEDLTEGKIDFDDATFVWHDNAGNDIGEGASIPINQNGTYEVEIILNNPCVDQNSLKGDVTVNNIYVPSNDSGDNNEYYGEGDSDNQNSDGIIEDNATVIPTKAPVADITANDEYQTTADTPSKTTRKKAVTEEESISLPTKDKDIIKPTPKKEKETVYTEITYGNNEETLEVASNVSPSGISGFLKKLGDFIKTPKGKIITVSLGTVTGIGLLFLLLYLLRNLVIVFNDDTDRKRHIIGIVKVTLKEEGYCLEIPESISRKAYTNRYAFFMGMFMIGRKSDTDILISLEDKRIVAKLSGIIETII